MKLEKLYLRAPYQATVRHARVGRVWLTARRGVRRAVAEKIGIGLRIDGADDIVRVRHG